MVVFVVAPLSDASECIALAGDAASQVHPVEQDDSCCRQTEQPSWPFRGAHLTAAKNGCTSLSTCSSAAPPYLDRIIVM